MSKHTHAGEGIAIAGGGLAAQRCVEALRREGYTGAIRMACAESHLPYDRPPLSKDLLAGTHPGDSTAYRSPQWYMERSIDVLLGVAAAAVDPHTRRLTLSDGTTLRYERMLIATGSRPRTLPMLEGYDNVSVLRTLEDSRRLRGAVGPGKQLVVIGAGFVGQEVAATARKLGTEVTMIEAADCPLAGILGQRIGRWFTEMHRAEGVRLHTGCTVDRVVANGDVRSLRLSNGQDVEADHVVVGIGVAADVAWLTGSGLETMAGVPVDAHGRSSCEEVLAVGDVAATFDPFSQRHVPGSHWEAAARQGARAARVMLDLDPGTPPLTSFWTDQYGIRIQYVGDARVADHVEIDGDPASRDFIATFTRAGRAVAALLVNRPRSLPAARKLIEKGTT